MTDDKVQKALAFFRNLFARCLAPTECELNDDNYYEKIQLIHTDIEALFNCQPRIEEYGTVVLFRKGDAIFAD